MAALDNALRQSWRLSVGNRWVEGLLLDTADTLAIDGGDLDVALVTPGGAPRVSDDVVVLAGGGISAIADGGDGVVEVGTAGGGVEDTRLVHLENELVSLDGDGGWGLGDGGLELLDGVGLDVGVARDLDLLEGLVGLAGAGGASARGVWVVRHQFIWVGLEVVEGRVLPATVATERGLVAGDNLLLGELDELAGLEEVSTLDGADGGEGPAGTASGLVLDWVDGTLGSPVNGVLVGWLELDSVVGLSNSGTEELLVLSISPGGELVVAKLEGGLLGVDLVDGLVLGGEELESELVLLLGSVRETVLLHVGGEGTLEVDETVSLVAVLGLDVGESSGFAEELHN